MSFEFSGKTIEEAVSDMAERVGLSPCHAIMGKTTFMLLQMLHIIEKAEEPIRIELVGHKQTYSEELKRRLLDYAVVAGIDTSHATIRCVSGTAKKLRGGTHPGLFDYSFEDHFDGIT